MLCKHRTYTVSQKDCAKLFLPELRQISSFPPILIIFGGKMAKKLKLCEVHSVSLT